MGEKYHGNRMRTNEILTAMGVEIPGILAINWVVVYGMLLRFLRKLQEALGWTSRSEGNEYSDVEFPVFLQQHVLGGLDLLGPGEAPNSLIQLTWLVTAQYFKEDATYDKVPLLDVSEVSDEMAGRFTD